MKAMIVPGRDNTYAESDNNEYRLCSPWVVFILCLSGKQQTLNFKSPKFWMAFG